MRSAPRSSASRQRGFMFTAILMPILVMALMQPLVALRMSQLAELERLNFEVKQMLAGKGKKLPVPSIAADAQLKAEVEVNSAFRF